MLFGMFAWDTVIMGVAAVAALVVVIRLFRNGLGTYAEARNAMQERIRKTKSEIDQCNKSTPVHEQLLLVHAATEEVLSFANATDTWQVRIEGLHIILESAEQKWSIIYTLRKAQLHASKKTLYGAGQWAMRRMENGAISKEDIYEFSSVDTLIRHVQHVVSPEASGAEPTCVLHHPMQEKK